MKQEQRIERDGQGSVQGVEAYAAAFGIVDGVGEEMIYIDQHARHHQGVVLQPFALIQCCGKRQWQRDVKKYMKDVSLL